MNKFKVGNRVSIVEGHGTGKSGVVTEYQVGYDNKMEYHVVLDGEKEDRVYFESSMVIEDIPDKNEDIILESTSSEIPDIGEPKFKIGDVIIDSYAESCPVYIVKDITTLIDGHDVIGYSYEVTKFGGSPDESIEIEYSESLVLEYHDTNWEEYFTESVDNGLPAWRGELYNWYVYDNDLDNGAELQDKYNGFTIPPNFMKHILEDHYILEKIGIVISQNRVTIMSDLHINDSKDLEKIRDEIKRKIRKVNLADTDIHHPGKMSRRMDVRFTPKEQKLVDLICEFDKKDLYPFSTSYSQVMTSLQVMHAIKEAYKEADKTGKSTGQTEKDKRVGEYHAPIKGQRVYRGYSKTYNLLIEFWFDLDLKVITTAYPVEGGM